VLRVQAVTAGTVNTVRIYILTPQQESCQTTKCHLMCKCTAAR
jgi:hypothetical protein